LELGSSLTSHVSFVASATSRDGVAVILKVPILGVDFAHAQANSCRYEPVALQSWAGTASVALLEYDPDSGGMVLERCDPGTRLADGVTLEAADTIAAELLAV